jgi:starch-binding outer membrane protein, SusD/RagB family
MKIINFFSKYKLLSLTILLSIASSCSEDFTNRPPEDAISLDAYYSSNEQVRSATIAMYNRTWFQFHNKFFFAIAEIGSGNMFSYASDVNAMRNFSISGSDNELNLGWQSLWANIAQSNAIINFLSTRVGPGVSNDVLQNTIGEAYFMRATAYFYLVRLWGPVPIIENNVALASSPQINTNRIEDIYQLIKNDYLKAAEKLDSKSRGSNYTSNAKVSKGSAKAMLAKVYLYTKEYDNAKAAALEVINSGEFKLLGGASLPSKSFGDLFTYPNNNNEESIFALQWKGNGVYGSASNCNTQFGISNGTISTSNASYGGVFAPSQDVLNLYASNDLRRKETLMLPGDVYPNIRVRTSAGLGTLTVPTADQIGGQNAGAAIKKYCIGIVNGTSTGPADPDSMMDNNTYIMRYAELLLIHAEATLAGGSSSTDASALSSLNAVRNRAGLSSLTSFTFNNVFSERRKELAFEGDYWFDLGRIPRAQAISIMAAQNRGDRLTPAYFTPTDSDFTLPYPANEVAKNPKLLEPPVAYTF